MATYNPADIDQIRVLTTDGTIHRLRPVDDVETVGETVRQTVLRAGIRDIAVVQAWGKPAPESPASANRDGNIYTWHPADIKAVAEAYRLAGLRLDDYLPAE